MRNIALAITLVILSVVATARESSGFASAPDQIHEQIIKDALSGSLNGENIAVIAQGCNSQDDPKGDGFSERHRHCRDANLARAMAYVDRESKIVLNYAGLADTSAADRFRCLYHFGMMLHTLHDFYSQTNYLELKADDGGERGKPIAPYEVELADWTQIKGMTPQTTNLVVEGVDKSTPATESGKKSLGDATYFKAARELAVKETVRQWDLLQTMIKLKYHGRASTILGALRQGSCPKNMKIDDPID